MGSRSGLGELEQLILLSILRLDDSAFGPDIARDLEDSVGRRVTRGALYSTLNRLAEKQLLDWTPEEPGTDRKGHIRSRFTLTPDGLTALRSQRETLLTLWDGVGAVLDAGGRMR